MCADVTEPAQEYVPIATRRRRALIVYSPDPSAVGRAFDFDGTTWLLGRSIDGPGKIADNRISREHVRILAGSDPETYIAEDLQTSNGTLLNGKPISGPTFILGGHVLRIGDTLIVVDQEPDPDTLPAAKSADGTKVHEQVGSSLVAERIRQSIATVAASEGTVLLRGPSGSGKEVAAAAIHRLGVSQNAPWIPVNCAAIPRDLAESQLFGHAKGMFTNAVTDHKGVFERASGGTLFLDEIGDLPESIQAKLLRVLESGVVEPIGGTPKRVEVRVIAATHKDLDGDDFRRDLYARMSDWVLHLPPLAQRRGDVLSLWSHFVTAENGSETRRPSPLFAEAMLLYAWPENVREIRKLAKRVTMLAEDEEVFELSHLPEVMRRPLRDRRLAEKDGAKELESALVQEVEAKSPNQKPGPGKAAIEAALRKSNGNVASAARENGWQKTQLYRWILRYGIDAEDFRGQG
jgi:DNA-binding NtrC family response regulator